MVGVPKVPLCFHTSTLGTLARVMFVSTTSLRLGPRSSHRPRVTPFCRLPACSVVGLNYSLVRLLLGNYAERCVRIVRYEIESHLSSFPPCGGTRLPQFPCYRLHLQLAELQRVVPTVRLHHLRKPAVSKLFPQGTLLHEHLAIYWHARIRLQHTEYLAATILITLLLHINASNLLSPCISSSSERSTQGFSS